MSALAPALLQIVITHGYTTKIKEISSLDRLERFPLWLPLLDSIKLKSIRCKDRRMATVHRTVASRWVRANVKAKIKSYTEWCSF